MVVRLKCPSRPSLLDNMAELRLGTSGWSYTDWCGPFYDSDKRMLQQYAEVFNTAEIDSTFYSYPTPSTVRAWVKLTPKDFVFAAKVPKLITHDRELNVKLGIEGDLKRFLELMSPLKEAGKLGPLLLQLPPSLKLDLDRLESALRVLPDGYMFAVEFRDPSWLRDEVFRLLERYKVAYVVVDEPLLPPLIAVTARFAYVRWHGRGSRPWYNYHYSWEELEPWVERLRELMSRAEVVYGYFNNHFHAYAVSNCLMMLKMLGMLSPRQAEALRRVESYFAGRRMVPPPVAAARRGMELYTILSSGDPSRLLELFMDHRRLKRASEIPDAEVVIEEATPRLVKARVKEYTVVLDVESKQLLHDCADWSRVAPSRQFCKHVGKLFMRLPRGLASALLRQIYEEREEWTFRPMMGELAEE